MDWDGLAPNGTPGEIAGQPLAIGPLDITHTLEHTVIIWTTLCPQCRAEFVWILL